MYDLARYDGVWLSVTETEITAALWHILWSIVVREELYVFSRQCHILCRHIRMTTYGLQVWLRRWGAWWRSAWIAQWRRLLSAVRRRRLLSVHRKQDRLLVANVPTKSSGGESTRQDYCCTRLWLSWNNIETWNDQEQFIVSRCLLLRRELF